MSKAVKTLVTAELKERYAGIDNACVVDLAGMNVLEQQDLRKRLREKSARLEVVKNSLAQRAFRESPLEPLGDALQGPCALVTSSDSLVEVAKVLVEVAKEYSQLTLKQAILEGDPSLLTVQDLAKMKTRTEAIGEIAMLVASPARGVAGCLGSPASKIAGCLKAVIDKAA